MHRHNKFLERNMIIELKKFGTMLVSRQAGKEALAAFQPVLKLVADDEKIVVDFDGVITFSPSWGDEFLTPLAVRYKGRIFFQNTKNLSVQATLKLLKL
jgi:STAS-like domain of unknown function (DUF4325)